jgi:hypothetical protein
MVQAVDGDYAYYLGTTRKSNNIPTVRQSQSEKDALASQNTKADVVEISPQAQAAMQNSNSIVSVGGKTSSKYDATAEQRTSTKAVAGRDSSSKQASSKVTSERFKTTEGASPELSDLSEAQMDCLVVKGTITKEEERLEFARRAEKEQSDAKEKAVTEAKRERAKLYRYPSYMNGSAPVTKRIQGYAT